jgi:plasmid stabilization system protein ParE
MKAVFYQVKMPKDGSWAMKINWTEPALEDLEAIQAYIAKDSNFYARRVIERLFDAAKKLESFPEIGRRVPDEAGAGLAPNISLKQLKHSFNRALLF